MFHYAHFHFCSFCRKKLIGIFAFCTMTGVIALDKCGKHWNVVTESWEMLFWCVSSISSGPLMLGYSLVAIMSKLTKGSKGFSGLLTSNVEILFSCGQGKERLVFWFMLFRRQKNILSAFFLQFIGSHCPYNTETLQLL